MTAHLTAMLLFAALVALSGDIARAGGLLLIGVILVGAPVLVKHIERMEG